MNSHYKYNIFTNSDILYNVFDVEASWVFLVTTLEFMGGGSTVSLEGSCTGAQHTLELGMVYVAWHGIWLLDMI